MRRREFLQVGAGTGLLAAAGSTGHASDRPSDGGERLVHAVPPVLGTYTGEDHRRRLRNIAVCERSIRRCLRKHLVTDYLPGQCVYNLGEYPAQKPWDPDDWDERELDKLRDQGVRLIQVHDEWHDFLRLFGGHTYTPVNPPGFRRFVDMVHARGIRLLVYVSSGFFDRRDPDFRREWARSQDLVEIFYRHARCSPASPGWRAYLLPRLTHLLDEYGIDGLYNDTGNITLAGNPQPPTPDEVLAFEERADHDGALEDLLALIYAEVKRRGGIVKIHSSDIRRPRTELKVYDYLWVGESVTKVDQLREAVKNHPPYVVPCLDLGRAGGIGREDELYLNAIPYMQFPLLLAGRPFTGERAAAPGIEYPDESKCYWTRHLRKIWRYHQAHPEGPHTYGWWDSVPGRPEPRPTWTRWLKQYLPLVEEGTRAYLEITDSDLFTGPLPASVVASAFANRELNLVLANYGPAEAEILTRGPYVGAADASGPEKRAWRLPPRSLAVLRRSGQGDTVE